MDSAPANACRPLSYLLPDRPPTPHRSCARRLPAQVWQQHGAWLQQHRPQLGPGIKERFEAAALISTEQFAAAVERRAAVRRHMLLLLGGDAVLLLPTTPTPAPPLDLAGEQLDALRGRLLQLLCIAGLPGFPQARNLPLHCVGCGVGGGESSHTTPRLLTTAAT